MRIHQLNLIRYGKFTDRPIELPLGEQDIHLIVGPNEAGKSTVRTAIGDWLFGIPARTPLAFLHPMPSAMAMDVSPPINTSTLSRTACSMARRMSSLSLPLG